MRPRAAELVAGAGWVRRSTGDGRVAVLAGSEQLAPPTLSAVVVPSVSADEPEGVEQASGATATRAFLACSRLILAQAPGQASSMLELATLLARRIPVYRVTMSPLTRATLPPPVAAVLKEHLGSAA